MGLFEGPDLLNGSFVWKISFVVAPLLFRAARCGKILKITSSYLKIERFDF
jgi:hypothetical protein